MSLIRSLKIGLSLDTREFASGARGAIGDLDKLTESSNRAQSSLRALEMGKSKGSAMPSTLPAPSEPTAKSDNSFDAAIAGSTRLGIALTAAIAPLTQIGSTLTRQFDAVGGTVTELSRRVDTALKYIGGDALLNLKKFQDEARKSLSVKPKGTDFGKLSSTGGVTKVADVSDVKAQTGAFQRLSQSIRDATARNTEYLEARRKGFAMRVNGNDLNFATKGDVAKRTLSQLTGKRFDIPATAPASATKLKGSLAAISPAANGAASAVKGLGLQIGLALGLVGIVYKLTSAVIGFFKSGITGAADLGESVSKTRAILGDSSKAFEAYADKVSADFGLVKRDVLDAGSSFGGLGKGIGNLKGKELSDFSARFTQLSADLQSFANTNTLAEASQALTIGLSGEQSDVLKRLGVIVNETTVKQYALAHGISSTKGQLSEQQKFAARAGIIQEKLADANGDLSRTFTSTKNQGRALSGTITNLGVTIGQVLEPAIGAAIGFLGQFAVAGASAFANFRPQLEAFASNVAAAFGTAGMIFRNFPSYIEIVRLKFLELGANALTVWETITGNFQTLGTYLANNWRKLLFDLVNSTKTMSENIDKNLLNLFTSIQGFFKGEGFNFQWTPMLEGFEATADKLPEVLKSKTVSMQGDIDKVLSKIALNEAAIKNGAGREITKSPMLNLSGGDGKGEEKEKKYKGTAVATLGSKEANEVLSKFRNQSSDEAPAKETAKNTKTVAEMLKESNAHLTTIARSFSSNPVTAAIAKL